VGSELNKIKLSLILAHYNQADFLDRTLNSITKQTFKDFETIIADDGSTDNTEEIIKKYPELQLRFISQNHDGFGKSKILNKAIVQTKSDYIVFIDSDCILEKHFLFDHFRSKQEGCFLSGRRVYLGPKITQRLADKGGISLVPLLWSALSKDTENFNRSFRIKSPLLRRSLGYHKLPDILGSNFSVFKDYLFRVNGFNEEKTGRWGEDGDLFLRLRNYGYTLKSVKGIAVQYHQYHPRPEPTAKDTDWYYKEGLHNFTYTYCKNGISHYL
jgi:glycosyltransferase involved in cell wall biosynthesis